MFFGFVVNDVDWEVAEPGSFKDKAVEVLICGKFFGKEVGMGLANAYFEVFFDWFVFEFWAVVLLSWIVFGKVGDISIMGDACDGCAIDGLECVAS